jgi:hypothetical protein
MTETAVHLVRGRDRHLEADALATAAGGRVGLAGVLADLNRRGEPAYPGRSAASYAFTWDREDSASRRWWPQGITSSADASDTEEYAGRRVLVTSAYSKVVNGLGKGARVSVVDVTDPERVRYRHVLLVRPELGEDGRLTVRPVKAHAGGLVWHGPWLHVAATARGFYTFHVDDVVAAGGFGTPDVLGPLPTGGLAGFGHRYLLPVRHLHAARTAQGAEPFRYSFLSLALGTGAPWLLAGEYGRGPMTTRLLGYGLEPATWLPAVDGAGRCRPRFVDDGGVERMQGAVALDGHVARLAVTTSAGRWRRGSMWTGAAGRMTEHPKALPPGPEDLCHWPSTDRLWTVTEYPRRRFVLALDRSRLA